MSEPTKAVEERMKEIVTEINLRIWPNDHLIKIIEGHIVGHGDDARREERARIKSTVQDAVDMLWPLTCRKESADGSEKD